MGLERTVAWIARAEPHFSEVIPFPSHDLFRRVSLGRGSRQFSRCFRNLLRSGLAGFCWQGSALEPSSSDTSHQYSLNSHASHGMAQNKFALSVRHWNSAKAAEAWKWALPPSRRGPPGEYQEVGPSGRRHRQLPSSNGEMPSAKARQVFAGEIARPAAMSPAMLKNP